MTLCRPEFSQFSESNTGFSFTSTAKSAAIYVVSGAFYDLANTTSTYSLPNVCVCTYEYLWPINRTRRFAANPTTTVCYLWQLLICVYLYTYRTLERRLNIAPKKLAWNPMLVLATYGDVVPSRDFPVLEIKYRLQFDKQREGVGHLSNGRSILRSC